MLTHKAKLSCYVAQGTRYLYCIILLLYYRTAGLHNKIEVHKLLHATQIYRIYTVVYIQKDIAMHFGVVVNGSKMMVDNNVVGIFISKV